jgi:hypothetical protein
MPLTDPRPTKKPRVETETGTVSHRDPDTEPDINLPVPEPVPEPVTEASVHSGSGSGSGFGFGPSRHAINYLVEGGIFEPAGNLSALRRGSAVGPKVGSISEEKPQNMFRRWAKLGEGMSGMDGAISGSSVPVLGLGLDVKQALECYKKKSNGPRRAFLEQHPQAAEVARLVIWITSLPAIIELGYAAADRLADAPDDSGFLGNEERADRYTDMADALSGQPSEDMDAVVDSLARYGRGEVEWAVVAEAVADVSWDDLPGFSPLG